jgi:hypothetical protein
VPSTTTSSPLEGTILANRSAEVARYFLEGQTALLNSSRSIGIKLPRPTSVLNLFNCAGDLADDTQGCYWDPYLIQQNGFYEIFDAAAAGAQAKLMLREAGAPPTGQVWVQNRTGQSESVVFKDSVYDIQPTAVQEFPVATGVPAILYVRNCLTVDGQSACEWAPKSLNPGVYYAMIEVDTPGSQSGSTRTTVDQRPVVGESQPDTATTSSASASTLTSPLSTSAPSISCSVVVPALNVRSGPGLQYDIIGKVRSTDGSAVMVNVTGRSADNEWLTVDPSIADNGWINNSPSFITCSADVLSLPIAEAPATPTPQAEIVAEPPTVGSAPSDVTPEPQAAQQPAAQETTAPVTGSTEVTPTASAPEIPPGQALLVVNNGFAHEIIFTLDQKYRVIEGPSEFDLQPGETISVVVFPGEVPFTASSPWSGLSGNASVHLEHDQSMPLWLRFDRESGGNWTLHYN